MAGALAWVVAQSFVLAAFATLVCQRNCVFLCKGTKLKNSAKPNSRTVCRFPPWYAFSPLIPAVWGFGLWLLRSQGFIGAKAGHSDRAVGEWRDLVLAFKKARQTLLFPK